MSRKDVLKGLLSHLPSATGSAAVSDIPWPAEAPRVQKGAIGAVSRSIADRKARSVVEMDPHLIDAGGMVDRLETDAGKDDALAASIRTYGQQEPVLVRPLPVTEGRFQIVHGRRRVLALRDLGQPVKALIRDLDDRELVIAQGQENTARHDLSLIEKVNFARQMEEAGYDRKVICHAISADKTLISRMLSIAAKIPPEVIEAIGAAPSVGRDRWQALADLIETADTEVDTMIAMLNLNARSPRSDDRFQALLDYLSSSAEKSKAARRGPPKAPVSIRAEDGLPLGRAIYDSRFLTLKLRLTQTECFETWLLDHLPALHRDWREGAPGLPRVFASPPAGDLQVTLRHRGRGGHRLRIGPERGPGQVGRPQRQGGPQRLVHRLRRIIPLKPGFVETVQMDRSGAGDRDRTPGPAAGAEGGS